MLTDTGETSQVPRFASRYHAVGLVAEDPAESIHAFLTRLGRVFSGIGNKVMAEKCMLHRVALMQDKETVAANAAVDGKRRRTA